MFIEGKKRNTKLMFHKIDPKRIEINPHYNLADFETFQAEHHNTFFCNTEYILSFWYEGKIAEFLGVYKLGKPVIDKINDSITGKERDRYQFTEMTEIDFFKEFKHRLYIRWTNPSANYGRWIDEDKYDIYAVKPVKENHIGRIPKTYYDINLRYQVLQKMFDYPIDNSDWKDYLSNRSGVYIILDESSKQQYIGSAYGEFGFWGRWENYANTGHGGNIGLKNLEYKKFSFSILYETLNSVSKEKVIEIESKFKNNLGTRVLGLNNN
jgi:hypothetical protein